jgi:hypothetical protein
MSPALRENVFQSGRIDKNYFSILRSTAPVAGNFHVDPIYFSLNHFESCSQEDLAQWLRKNPSMIHKLSPLRKRQLPIRLSERMEWMKLKNTISEVKLVPKSQSRALATQLEIGSFSVEDEQFLFQHPEQVDPAWCSSIPSLVWLALCESPQRVKILEEYDARELAFAWVGPQIVLDRISADLPESKLKNLKYYLTKVVEPLFRLNLNIFNSLLNEKFTENDCDKFIDRIKLTKIKIKNFNKFLLDTGTFKKTVIFKNQLL